LTIEERTARLVLASLFGLACFASAVACNAVSGADELKTLQHPSESASDPPVPATNGDTKHAGKPGDPGESGSPGDAGSSPRGDARKAPSPLMCRSESDCDDRGHVCCLVGGFSTCMPAGACPGSVILCEHDSQCDAPLSCLPNGAGYNVCQ
jgi:hypothetical protein